jgi:hypothetical protein
MFPMGPSLPLLAGFWAPPAGLSLPGLLPGVVGVPFAEGLSGLLELFGWLPLVEVSDAMPGFLESEPQAMATNPAPTNTRLTAANDLERSKRLMRLLRKTTA